MIQKKIQQYQWIDTKGNREKYTMQKAKYRIEIKFTEY